MEYINKTDLAILFEHDLSNPNMLETIFSSNRMHKSGGTVFVINDEKQFKGIITVGDYVRHKKFGDIVMNSDCKRVFSGEDEWKNAMIIHTNFPKIRIIPIIERASKMRPI